MEVLAADSDGRPHAGHEGQHTADRRIRLAKLPQAGGHEHAKVTAYDVPRKRSRGELVELVNARAVADGHAVKGRGEKRSADELLDELLQNLFRMSVESLRVVVWRAQWGGQEERKP